MRAPSRAERVPDDERDTRPIGCGFFFFFPPLFTSLMWRKSAAAYYWTFFRRIWKEKYDEPKKK
jgi:hypothetical protein